MNFRIGTNRSQMNSCCLLLFLWPPFHEVHTNYEVVMFQPWTGIPLDLGSVANCYISILLIPAPPFSDRHLMSARGVYPLMSLLSLPCQSPCLHTGSFTHPGVTFLQPSITRPVVTFIRLQYLPASPALSTPDGFPTSHPCRCHNIF